MSADIFNAWEVLAASTVATIITGGIAVAWAQGRLSLAQQYWAAGEHEFDKAERLAAEVERTRNLPWYWPTGPAVKAAPVEPEPEVTADDAVTGEVLAVDGVDTETDAPHEDTDRPRWWATVVAFVVLAPVAFARRQWPVLVAWWRSRRRPVNQPYRGRHWVSDVQHTAEWPVVNPSIPAQRSGDADE